MRIHGRGGQGVVSASQIMSVAAFHQGLFSQSFPSFGSERMGAPVKAYVRFDQRDIELREPVIDPDVLIIQDDTLFNAIDVFAGLKPDGKVLINTRRSLDELGVGPAVDTLPGGHVCLVPATDLAQQHLKRPTPNTALLGAFAAMTGLLEMSAVERAIMEKFPGEVGKMNVNTARATFETVAQAEDS